MIFKGYSFRKNQNLVVLEGSSNYLGFGRVLPDSFARRLNGVHNYPKEAVEVKGFEWPKTGNPVFAMPIKLTGHSLTNLAYGADGRMYLAKDGQVFTAVRRSV